MDAATTHTFDSVRWQLPANSSHFLHVVVTFLGILA
jgi:hypothetical protein